MTSVWILVIAMAGGGVGYTNYRTQAACQAQVSVAQQNQGIVAFCLERPVP